MLSKYQLEALRTKMQSTSLIAIAAVMMVAGLVPVVFQGSANAATLASRNVVISTSEPSATGVQYTFGFTPSTGVVIQGVVFKFCTTPLGACTLPTGMNVGYATASYGTQTGFTPSTAFADYTGANAGGCDGQGASGDNTATTFCLTRTETNPDNTSAKTIRVDSITNPSIPSGNNTTVYVRVALYSDTGFTTLQHDGTVAASIVNQLTVTGRVQERLVFCVFALSDAAGSGAVGSGAGNLPTDCAATEAAASSSIDIGVIDNTTTAVSPVDNNPPTATGNDRFGAAIINTNASSGVTMAYYAAAGTGTNELRAFRVPGATCDVSGTSLVDQCFISADDSTPETLTAGTERFGMYLACVDNSTSTSGAIGTTSNLGFGNAGNGTAGTFNTVYDNNAGNLAGLEDTGDCENDTGPYDIGWHDSGTAQALISSSTVVDDEMVKLRFGATAAATTPTGSYTVASTYIATPVF